MSLRDRLYELQLRTRHSLAARRFRSLETNVCESVAERIEPSNILFVLSGLIGDSVMSQPAIDEARDQWPSALITVLGKKHNIELLNGCPSIDRSYECNSDPFSLRRSKEITELQNWLGAANFDAAFILLGDQFAHLLAKAQIPVRVGVRGTPLETCLTHAYDIGSPRTWGTRERLNCLRVVGCEVDGRQPKLCVDGEAAASVREKLSGSGLGETEPYIVLHPFGSSARQWWSADKLVPLARAILETQGLKTVLVGGPETMVDLGPTKPMVDVRGELSLPELVAGIDGSQAVITTDSGPFHIAGALGKKIVGLFRARRPEHAEAYPNAQIIFGESAECADLCEWDKCRRDPCCQMQRIALNAVIDAVKNTK